MSVWLCIPSKRPLDEIAARLVRWRDRGYKIALWRDDGRPADNFPCDLFGSSIPYPGYAVATNELIRQVLAGDQLATWCVIGGDDVEPDMRRPAKAIAEECERYFGALHFPETIDQSLAGGVYCDFGRWSTLGVMQPTGDRWGDSELSRERYGARRGAYIDRIAGSAWLGREFCERAYGGNGPLWPAYRHMFVDEELHDVAELLGLYWPRPDLVQLHQHWGRKDMPTRDDIPEFLKEVNSGSHWAEYGNLFRERKAAGFPGHELAPLARPVLQL